MTLLSKLFGNIMYIEKKMLYVESLIYFSFFLNSHLYVQNRHGNVQIVKIIVFIMGQIDAFGDGSDAVGEVECF